MKQLLFLLLFPCFALAQYQGNANQKITLGEQTTADGLVWRGIRADTTSKIVPFSDTSAYIILDTVEKTLWLYKAGQVPKWQQVGGSTLDTATMLLPYYRAGRNTIIQANDVPTLNQNTTGSAATLTTGRTIQTNLASTSAATFNGSANITPGVTGTLPVANGGTNTSTAFTAGSVVFAGASGTYSQDNSNLFWDNTNKRLGIGTTSPASLLNVLSTKTTALSTAADFLTLGATIDDNTDYANVGIGGGIAFRAKRNTSGTQTVFGAIDAAKENASNDDYRGALRFWTNQNATGIPLERMRITSGDEVWIGYTTDQGAYRLQVKDSVYVGGNVSASAYTTRSDYDLKDEIQNISYGINEVMQMQPVKYTYKSNGSTQLGFIAQDLGVITPEVVSFEDKMSVYYNALIPILTKAIQEQQALIKALEQRIINLENK